ncbi:glycine--tRNA ligase subunit beta [Sulfobacillus sp. hq2]|uniref:glycine--tRNA ligase subunit beta n=1 Tax=Sulfobacillus TaxID=28033 RepID=UPI000CD0861E|nr:glycine--tRNA ligase subunit beta [Sulfobacillus sp. hq2]POB11698.1 glycine--tRNA ligase subunit beta [Sulfobacillus sp. hq2]
MMLEDALPLWRPFLVEVGVEEIPSQYIRDITSAYRDLIMDEFALMRLSSRDIAAYATPRRLVVMGQVSSRQSPLQETVRGPLMANAYQNGVPTPALLGFCRRLGIGPAEVQTMGEGDKTYVCAVIEKPIEAAEDLLPGIMERAFAAIPLARSMRWGDHDYRFIRPVRWCSLWLDDQALPLSITGVASQPYTYGNRTDQPGALEIRGIASYEQALAQGFVVLDPMRRQEAIVSEADELAASVGGVPAYDEGLMEEVVNLVEWPTPFLGAFDAAFLEVPQEVLMTSMKVHQRYFPVIDGEGRLMPYFIGVRNGIGRSLETVVHGNEKVLRARLSDALYFYRADRRHRLEDYVEALDRVVFHAKLGTYGDKIRRLHHIFQETRDEWPLTTLEQDLFHRTLDLYKTDLLTQVVQEFPELQGTMGGIYAEQEGLPTPIVQAIRDQYHPGYQGDIIPETTLGRLLVLLDRLDTVLLGLSQGLKPTGSEDPFGMRRSALAIGRILMESQVWEKPARHLFDRVGHILGVDERSIQEAFELTFGRVTRFLESDRHIAAQWSTPVLQAACPWHTFSDRLSLLERLHQKPDWELVAQAYKRIDRVIGDTRATDSTPEVTLPAELAVQAAVEQVRHAPTPDAWWNAVQTLSEAVRVFFDAVLVNDPDPQVQAARKQLLALARTQYNRYFDMSQV